MSVRRTLPTVLLTGLLLSGCGESAPEPSAHPSPVAADAPATEAPATSETVTEAAPATPVRLTLDGIGEWDLTALGLDADGFVNPPPGVVQWYDGSPLPGEDGTAVVAGHVTWGGTPDAFVDLHTTRPGDELRVVDSAGTERVFEVTEVRAVDKDDLTYDTAVWGPADEPRLALVTCDSDSPVEAGGHFADNLVVEAVQVDG